MRTVTSEIGACKQVVELWSLVRDLDILGAYRGNLTEASYQCQARNCGMRSDNRSGVKGISWCSPTNNWRAQIKVNGRFCFLGKFETILEAAYARYAAEQCLGFQDCDLNSSAKQFISSPGLSR